MAVNLYEGFTNKISGETFRVVSFTEDAYSFEWVVKPGGYIPFEHIHLTQDEVFYIKKGELKMVIDGKEYIVGEGQRITVPKGKRHIAYNNKPVSLHAFVDYRPGLDTYRFFQCFAGLIRDGEMSKNGTVNIPRMLYFTRKIKAKCIARPTSIPAPVFYLAIHTCFIIGSILGWKKQLIKYTDGK